MKRFFGIIWIWSVRLFSIFVLNSQTAQNPQPQAEETSLIRPMEQSQPVLSPSLDEALEVAQNAALLAGSAIREAWSQSSKCSIKSTKSSSTDLVTETDHRCEALITNLIRSKFPDHKIIGEESSGSDRYILTDAPTWTIDPIDGTTNFVHRLALTCVLVSYIVNREVCVGVVYDPAADEMFWAIKNKGAYLKKKTNGPKGLSTTTTRIHVSDCRSIPQALVSVDPGYGRDPATVRRFCAVQSALLLQRVRNIRVFGCTGLNMAYVACGRLDAAFEEGSWESNTGPKIWDFAAGKLLLVEAGGVTRDISSPSDTTNSVVNEERDSPLDLMQRSFFCASTDSLANEILDVIAEGRSKSIV